VKILILSSLLFLASCAHSVQKNIKDIQAGMTRADVIDDLGSPLYVDRSDPDKHIWVYRYYDKEEQRWVRKAVYFTNDIVEKLDEAPKRKVVLENTITEPLDLEEAKPARRVKGAIKDQPGVGSEDWYQEIKRLEAEKAQSEKEKTVPSFKNIN
tara:strand:- start:125382 stop:125843 length:462 start_codon:yes stop_codon:yes gene_type:complete